MFKAPQVGDRVMYRKLGETFRREGFVETLIPDSDYAILRCGVVCLQERLVVLPVDLKVPGLVAA